MLNLDTCKKILNNDKKKYKDDEIKLIRDYLYLLAELQIENNENDE